jgi:hypothetical protein
VVLGCGALLDADREVPCGGESVKGDEDHPRPRRIHPTGSHRGFEMRVLVELLGQPQSDLASRRTCLVSTATHAAASCAPASSVAPTVSVSDLRFQQVREKI